jgi:O-antigen/teichoic acid export membrane protein
MQIVKNSIIYLGSSILNKMIPFLLLPVMTKYLTPKEYGILSIYLIIISVYNAFIGMNMHTNVSKNYFKISKEQLSLYIGNIFYILSITFVFYSLVNFVVSIYFDTVFSIPSQWLLIIPFISVMMMVNEINTTILRNEQRAYMFGVFEVSNTISKMGFTVLFLLVFSMSWYSQVIGTLIGALLFSIVGIVYMRKRNYISMKFDKEKIKSILNISIPLIPHVLGGVVIAMSDRLFIEKMVSIEAVGIYSVGYMFGMIVMLFTDAFIKAWSPWFYRSLMEPTDSKKERIVKYTYIYIVGIFTLAIFISIIGEFILPYFVDEKFFGASEFILWISIGYAIQGVYKIFFPYLVHISRTSFLAVSTVMAAFFNLLFNYLFIKQFGTIGAAYATALSFAVSALLVFWYQQKHYNMPWVLKL